MATSEKKSKVNIIIIIVLAVVAVGLGVVLAITYDSRYDEGVKVGKAEQIESIKGDRYKCIVGDLVGLNADQAGYWTLGEDRRIHINTSTASLPLLFKTPSGEAITENNIKDYKVVSQEPKANTVFDITYEKYSDGEEADSTLATSGVQNVTLTLEKVK